MSQGKVAFLVLLSVGAWGCQSATKPDQKAHKTSPAETVARQNASLEALPANPAGYALLYGLVSDEKDVSKLSWIKHLRPEVKTLTKEISATNRAAAAQMRDFAKADSDVTLKGTGLPAFETATRDSIAAVRQKMLLHAKGNELEVQLLLTQNEALTYATYLAAQLATNDSDEGRREYFRRLSESFDVLRRKVVAIFLENYHPPSAG